MIDRKQIESLVRERLTVALKIPEKKNETSGERMGGSKPLDFVNEQIVLANQKGHIYLTPKAIITPSARDLADQYGVTFHVSTGGASQPLDDFGPQSVVIGADHGGFPLKEEIKRMLKSSGYEIVDVGTHNTDAVDYPDFASAVATLVAKGQCRKGIMIDSVGIASAMVANKIKGIRAAHCRDIYEAKSSREHNDANVLTLGGKVIGSGLALELVKVWMETPFAGGRHKQRVDKMMRIESAHPE